MLIIAVLVLLAAAAVGAVVATKRVRGDEVALPLSLLHGALAATGLLLALLTVVGSGAPALVLAGLILLAVVAAGGIVLFALPRLGRSQPRALIAIHALAAVTAVVLLALSAFGIA